MAQPTFLIRGMLFAARHWHILLLDGTEIEGNFLLAAVDQIQTHSRIRAPAPKQIILLLMNQDLLWPKHLGDPNDPNNQHPRPLAHPLRWSDDMEAQGNLVAGYWFEDPLIRHATAQTLQQTRRTIANDFHIWAKRYQTLAFHAVMVTLTKLNTGFRLGKIDEFTFEQRGMAAIMQTTPALKADFRRLAHQRQRLLKRDLPDLSTLPPLMIMTHVIRIHPNSQTPAYPQADYDFAQADQPAYQQAMYDEFLASEQFRLNLGLPLTKKYVSPFVLDKNRWTIKQVQQWLLDH